MESADENKSFELPLGFSGGMFVFFMLVSIDGIFDAERALSRGWFPGIDDRFFVRLFVPELWVLGVLLGLILWQSGRRGAVTRNTAGIALMILGTAISSAYEVLGKFANGR